MNRFDTTLTPLLGRLMLAAIFLWSGLGKLFDPAAATGYIEHTGLPQPQLAYYVALAVELGGGILLSVGLLTRIVAVVLALWCLVTAVIFHLQLADIMQMINAYKNLAMAGGLLYVAAYGPGLWSLDASLLGRRSGAIAA